MRSNQQRKNLSFDSQTNDTYELIILSVSKAYCLIHEQMTLYERLTNLGFTVSISLTNPSLL